MGFDLVGLHPVFGPGSMRHFGQGSVVYTLIEIAKLNGVKPAVMVCRSATGRQHRISSLQFFKDAWSQSLVNQIIRVMSNDPWRSGFLGLGARSKVVPRPIPQPENLPVKVKRKGHGPWLEFLV